MSVISDHTARCGRNVYGRSVPSSILFGAWLVVAGCASQPLSRKPPLSANQPASPRIVASCGARRGDTSRRYIVPAARAATFYNGPRGSVTAFFQPSEAEVAAFAAELPSFLRSKPTRGSLGSTPSTVSSPIDSMADDYARDIAQSLELYRGQFTGVVLGGVRWVFGNFFADDSPISSPVDVDDGGECYFQVFYNPATRAFSDLSVNGGG